MALPKKIKCFKYLVYSYVFLLAVSKQRKSNFCNHWYTYIHICKYTFRPHTHMYICICISNICYFGSSYSSSMYACVCVHMSVYFCDAMSFLLHTCKHSLWAYLVCILYVYAHIFNKLKYCHLINKHVLNFSCIYA